jgi:SMI1 / KNR4 family protein
LPDSYKEMLLNYEFISVCGIDFKSIAPPEYQEDADFDIYYTYQVNLQNNLFQKDELAFLEMDEEAYFFKIEEAGQANEYPVYIRDYMMNEDHLYANNFQEFLEHFFSILLGND